MATANNDQPPIILVIKKDDIEINETSPTQSPGNKVQVEDLDETSEAEQEPAVITLNNSSDSLLNSATDQSEALEDTETETEVSDMTLIGTGIDPETTPTTANTRKAALASKEKGYFVNLINGSTQSKTNSSKSTTNNPRAKSKQKQESEEKDKLVRKLTENEGAINRLTLELSNEEKKGKEREKKLSAMETLVTNLKSQRQALTKQLNDSQTKLKKAQNDLTNKTNQTPKQEKKTQEEKEAFETKINNLLNDNKKLKEDKEKLQTEKHKLKDEKKGLQEEKKELKAENNNLEIRISNMDDAMATIATNNTEKVEELETNLRTALEQHPGTETSSKIKELESDLEEGQTLICTLYEKIDESDDSGVLEVPEEPKREVKRALLIADSNRQAIIPNLSATTDWSHMEDIFTAGHLEEWLTEENVGEDFDIVVIHEGTNDIRKGGDGRRFAKRIMRSAKVIKERSTHTQVAVVEMPPLRDEKANDERRLFNYTLSVLEKQENVKVIKTAETLNSLDLDEQVLTKDGFHIRNKAGNETADLIEKAIDDMVVPNNRGADSRKQHTPPNRKVQDSTTWEVPTAAIGLILGKGGKNIRQLEEDFRVNIDVGKQVTGSKTQTIIVKGTPTQVTKATEKIKGLTDKHTEEAEKYKDRRNKTSDIECVFFQKGHCVYGNSCMYRHEPKQPTPHHSRNDGRHEKRRPHINKTHRSRSPVARR